MSRLSSKRRLHLGIGHYGIGFKDGVNTVISRNVRALLKIGTNLKITLFGKLSADYPRFIKPVPGRLEYREIEEFDPEVAVRQLKGKSISQQQVHDYMWQGTNIAEILVKKLSDMEVIIAENLGIGIHPALTYAFYLYTHYSYTMREKKKLIYRFHDFVQQRPVNFQNVKKFHHTRFSIVPDWHSVLYPAYPNIKYIAINRNDRWRLIEHGIDEQNIYYIPNPVDQAIIPPDDRTEELREKIIQREKLDPSTHFILYPVRCIRRKNVEEAIFLTKFFNCLAEGKTSRSECKLKGKFHLLVSIKSADGEDTGYAEKLAEFVKKYNLPVTIGLEDFVSLEREYDPHTPGKIRKYGIGDLYRVADFAITTSTLEGFGFMYVEPWIMDKPVIGRNIPVITPDFQAAGMKLDHLYTALLVEGQDFKDIGQQRASPDEALQERLSKILKLKDPAYIDRFIEANETTILATLRLFDEKKREKLILRNKEIVEKVYSAENIGKKLYEVITSD
jgi:glycosyltransferase involved in cell wall biosynthesis